MTQNRHPVVDVIRAGLPPQHPPQDQQRHAHDGGQHQQAHAQQPGIHLAGGIGTAPDFDLGQVAGLAGGGEQAGFAQQFARARLVFGLDDPYRRRLLL